MKVLNLYAGIGGNRKLWGDNIEVTAVERDPQIARIYKHYFPKDRVIVGDAHRYLLKHFEEFDFIWSSPPCPNHSDIRRCGVDAGRYMALYPDMRLYQEIIFLQFFFKKKFVVENVISYYDPLIKPIILGRHYFWTNFPLPSAPLWDERIHNNIVGSEEMYGFEIGNEDVKDKRKILRNLVNPKLGLHIFNCAFREPQLTLAGY